MEKNQSARKNLSQHGKTSVSTRKTQSGRKNISRHRENLSQHGKTSVSTEKLQSARKNFSQHGNTSVSTRKPQLERKNPSRHGENLSQHGKTSVSTWNLSQHGKTSVSTEKLTDVAVSIYADVQNFTYLSVCVVRGMRVSWVQFSFLVAKFAFCDWKYSPNFSFERSAKPLPTGERNLRVRTLKPERKLIFFRLI